MARAATDSFILELKLKTSEEDARFLEKCMYFGWKVHNTLVRHCQKQLASLRQDPEYRELLTAYRKEADRADKQRINRELSAIVAGYGLTEYSLHAFVAKLQHKFRKWVHSAVAQKIATHVWQGVRKVLYAKGKELHFLKYVDFTTLEGKQNTTGIVFADNRIRYAGCVIDVRRHRKDGSSARKYECEALRHRVKYCRIIRRVVGQRFHYYVQLVLEGMPPIKHYTGSGTAGLDIGTSTAAVVTDQECILTVLGENVAAIEREKRHIQRKMDRSRRAANPGNYTPDGTVRRGRKVWVKSITYRKLQRCFASLCRKRAAALKQSHQILANHIIAQCDTLYVEKMSFKGLQRCSGKQKDGRSGRKKRFGKSIQNRAPAQFCSILRQKLERLGGQYLEVNTRTFRASQYNHVTDTYSKKPLSRRGNSIEGRWVQRDLYSAFLLKNSADSLRHTDRAKCIGTYPAFLLAHDACIQAIRHSETTIPKSFGFQAFT